ncbi:hypothetical protein BKA83DRAFT_680232 [Pisolithus microcarpus]|nr:hypothetical protein BKA83DRAFT_680232 [Pisolithus microcarpus]
MAATPRERQCDLIASVFGFLGPLIVPSVECFVSYSYSAVSPVSLLCASLPTGQLLASFP